MISRRRASPTVLLTAAVLVLLPLLAVLQYHWLSRIGEETGSRMRAVAMSAAEAMSADLAFEAGRAWRDRLDGADSSADADSPPLVVDALVVDRMDAEPAPPRVRRWDLDKRACEPAAWPGNYGAVPEETHHAVELLQACSTSLGIVPVDLAARRGRPPAVRPPCDVSGKGLVVFRLDPNVLRNALLPEVARRHLIALRSDDFHLAIVSGSPPREVIYSSPGTDAAAVAAQPDVWLPLTLAEPDRVGMGGRGRGGRDRILPAGDDDRGRGYGRAMDAEARSVWLFVAQHRAGSLRGAVNRLRARNLVISLGILSLLGVAVALIAVSARRAERLGRQQVQFVAAVSHEMRTPVTGIDLAARNLEDGLIADPARVRRYGGVIRAEARRLAETVERVLQFATLEAGRSVRPAEVVDARAIVEDVVVRARDEQRDATIEFDVEGEDHLVRADAATLRSAVQNLVANALKYGGTPAWARVRVSREGAARPELRVTVEDRGPGIDPRDLPHVFDAFYRGRQATERRVPGNGLGLHIVKRGVEAIGGRVDVRTGRGSGTAVTLHLPLPAMGPDDGEPTTPAAGRG